jgi:signal transduction histidine kinase
VVVDLDEWVAVDQHQRHALVRITREAVANAVRHGRAECVHITLEATASGARLVVRDDGGGFDPACSADASGYGLTSMQARARALPGTFDLRTAPGVGTTIEVTW